MPICWRWCALENSGRTFTIGSQSFRWPSRRCANGRKILLSWRDIFWGAPFRRTGSGKLVERSARPAPEGGSWPGNVRELQNVIVRALIFAAGQQPRSACPPDALSYDHRRGGQRCRAAQRSSGQGYTLIGAGHESLRRQYVPGRHAFTKLNNGYVDPTATGARSGARSRPSAVWCLPLLYRCGRLAGTHLRPDALKNRPAAARA